MWFLPLAYAATLEVPAVYTTVQAALNASVAGDVVQLAEGVYCEDLNMQRAVTLKGMGPELTVIDGTCGSGSAILYYTGAGAGGHLEDLSIDGANGFTPLWVDTGRTLTATRLTVRNGQAKSGTGNDGGGIYVDDNATFACTDCRIEDSAATEGGGIYATSTARIELTDSVVCGNFATATGGGLGGAGTTIVRRTAFVRNESVSYGGGAHVRGFGGHLFHNTVFLENVSPAIDGAALAVLDAADVRNSIFVGNQGGIAIDNDDEVNSGGYNLYADNPDGDVVEPYPNDLFGGLVPFADPGIGCTFDLSFVAGLPNDARDAGDPVLGNDPDGSLPDLGIYGGPTSGVDADGDGFYDVIDCQLGDDAAYPGAPESCNGLDDDCDGLVPSNEFDVDGDGYAACDGDCAPSDGGVYPGAPTGSSDVGDGTDRDCDGFDECFLDADTDGFGVGTVVPPGADGNCAGEPTDCDDTNDAVYPGAAEICDTRDNDCDGATDDADPDRIPDTTFFADSDGDGFGDPYSTTDACELPTGYSVTNDDCNDGNDAVNPDASEVCDTIDNDCDGATDDADPSVSDQPTWYLDGDGDGYGAGAGVVQCGRPVGHVANADDCDDGFDSVSPDAPEQCDGVDNDCDGTIDNDVLDIEWYPDADDDGFGDPSGTPVTACAAPGPYYAPNASDCDDSNSAMFPGNPFETPCDGFDNDCDPSTPDDDGSCDTGGTGDTGSPADTDTDTDADTDADTDTDTDADTDTDTDTDADTDTDTDADTDSDTDSDTDKGVPEPQAPDYGCGCSGAPSPGHGVWLAPLLLTWTRRARR